MVGFMKDFSGAPRDFKVLYEKLNMKINKARTTLNIFNKTHNKTNLATEYLTNRIEEAETKKNELEDILKQSQQNGSISL